MAQPCQCGPNKDAVLCLDGGGVRGLSSLLILEALMDKCGQFEREDDRQFLRHELTGITTPEDTNQPLPCHYFDYVVGTSTGGLIALMLGRLRMTVAHAIRAYETLTKDVFGKRRPWRYDQFNHEKLQEAIVSVVKNHCRNENKQPNGDDLLWDPEPSPHICRCAVLALRRDDSGGSSRGDTLHFFRSYFHPQQNQAGGSPQDWAQVRNPGADERTYIWEAARATSAAPHYFKEMDIHNARYMDAGIEVSNPCGEAWNEVRSMHRLRCSPRCNIVPGHHFHCDPRDSGIGILVSVGTGKCAPLTTFSDGNFVHKFAKLVERAKYAMTESEDVHGHIGNLAQEGGVRYHRLNVSTGLEKIKMDQCNLYKAKGEDLSRNVTLDKIRGATAEYLSTAAVQQDLASCARYLVDQRRARTAGRHAARFRGLTRAGPLETIHLRQQRRSNDIDDDSDNVPARSATLPANYVQGQHDALPPHVTQHVASHLLQERRYTEPPVSQAWQHPGPHYTQNTQNYGSSSTTTLTTPQWPQHTQTQCEGSALNSNHQHPSATQSVQSPVYSPVYSPTHSPTVVIPNGPQYMSTIVPSPTETIASPIHQRFTQPSQNHVVPLSPVQEMRADHDAHELSSVNAQGVMASA